MSKFFYRLGTFVKNKHVIVVIIASGFTVIGGFAALLIAIDFPILRDFGMVTVIDVSFALVSTLVVLPPLIVWLDSWERETQEREVRTQRLTLHASSLRPMGESSPYMARD